MNSNHDCSTEELLFAAEATDIPLTYVKVWRWVSAGEAEMWELNPHCVPQRLRETEALAVTIPAASKPPETGPIRIEFWIDKQMIQATEQPDWLKIRAPIAGTPVAGLHMYWNQGLSRLVNLSGDLAH